ncbi:16S rRNA (cytosine(967)-C(5))-methyltransferase RsmB [Mycoplasma sp. P36-A1]|uniref:16S rRNA (cytosine(967)-C(5))-methyltransferase RsmB n=1 Tax=Mycoplasma sp. P36-A1 TaxID=3252900 RepID=UPI003C2EE19F
MKDYKNPRLVAYEAIYEVMFKEGYSNLILQKSMNALSEKDKGLCTTITYGTIQNFDLLNYQLTQVHYDKLNNKQLCIIIMSLFQKHFLTKIPDYAIIQQAEKVTEQVIDRNAKRFVVALLKQLLELPLIYAKTDNADKDLAINYSHPLWMIKMLKKQYGEETLLKILKSNNAIAKTHIRYNILSNKLDEVLKDPNVKKSEVVENGYYYLKGDLTKQEMYLKGYISIQDFSSQQVAIFADPKPDMKVLDMCAAPGTKTTHLAELMQDKGQIDAIDIYAHKIDLINEGAKRLDLKSIKTYLNDSTKLTETIPTESYDLILCDAVCTGLGVIKRKPEIKYQNIGQGMDEIMDVQRKLLEQAYQLLKKGGTLVYSTCTINKKENETMIAKFIEKHNDDLTLIAQKQILGFEVDGDGFYMAKIIKK